ncbi:MAG: hypothetical protein IJ242_09805 [Clostridia bacterium]|nr:hypothetical protein [Clostridia bacterium]
MKIVWKKLCAMICCLLLVACLVCVAQAESASLTGGIYKGNAVTIAIPKEITVTNINPDVAKVFGPAVTYTYSIAPITLNANETRTVTSADGATINVQPGKTGAVDNATANVQFTSSEVALNGGKANISGKAEFTFKPVDFGAPGVYRYVITDTTSEATLYNAGIIRKAEYITSYYLDIYVAYKEGTEKTADNLEIQGYSFFGENGNITAGTQKLSEFVSNNPEDVTLSANPTSPAGDLYPTFNTCVTTQVKGNMADATHEFPVAVTIENQGIHFFTLKGTISTGAELTEVTPTACTTLLKHNEVFHVIGLNVHGRITTEETNNTSDTYQIEIKNKTNAVLTESTSTAPGVKATHSEQKLTDWPSSAPSAYLTTVALTDANTQITYINQLNSVSPTGIVRHIAPYVMILGFAFFFAVLFRRRREETAEE